MTYTVYTDGGSRGNPGPAAIGVVVTNDNGEKESLGKYLGVTTNNTAEYQAVIEAFQLLKQKGERGEINFFLDSLLVVQQLKGLYKIKDANLRMLWEHLQTEIKEWGSPVIFTHVRRELNREADKIVNQTLDKQLSSQ